MEFLSDVACVSVSWAGAFGVGPGFLFGFPVSVSVPAGTLPGAPSGSARILRNSSHETISSLAHVIVVLSSETPLQRIPACRRLSSIVAAYWAASRALEELAEASQAHALKIEAAMKRSRAQLPLRYLLTSGATPLSELEEGSSHP